MPRCHSDPCTSSSFSQHLLASSSPISALIRAPSLPPGIGSEGKVRETRKSGSTAKSKLTRQLSDQNLARTPKPSAVEKKEEVQEKGNVQKRTMKSNVLQSPRCSLLRTPSLPASIGREELSEEDENDIRMSKLIRQAFAYSPDILPPRYSTSKGNITQTSSIPRSRPPRNVEVEAIKSDGIREMRRRYLNQKSIKKSLNDLEVEELQGFKDLGFTFNEEDLNQSVVNILPGLQEKKKREGFWQDKIMRKPYLSEAWVAESCAPPFPSSETKSSVQDMKAQIKFWARAVATNVRQEC